MSEFCAGVKILLERMKSNPEDFEMVEFDMATDQGVQGRFYRFAQSMDDVILGKQHEDRPWRDWQYLTEGERQALIEGFKEMKRAKFDKEIMERVFDEKYIERQQEAILYSLKAQSQPQFYSLKAAQVQNLAISAQQGGTGFSDGGLVKALGNLGGIFK